MVDRVSVVGGEPGLSARDRDVLERWWATMLRTEGSLPSEIEPVQGRLIRSVGRARLPDAGDVYVKVMGFPRWRDRLRYAFRAMPGPHEAAMLARARRHGVPVPELAWVRGSRRLGWWPRLSVLVTRALPRVDAVPTPVTAAQLACRLAAAGVFHPDLHRDNFVVGPDGTVAVLDLQSARARARVGPGARRAMAARLLQAYAGSPSANGAMQGAGLVGPEAARQIAADAEALALEALRRRVGRCLTTSTEFERRWTWRGVLRRRRGCEPGPANAWLRGGRELRRLWMGDRALEILDGRPPSLGALFENWWWLPGNCSVYIAAETSPTALSDLGEELLEGYEKFMRLFIRSEARASGDGGGSDARVTRGETPSVAGPVHDVDAGRAPRPGEPTRSEEGQ